MTPAELEKIKNRKSELAKSLKSSQQIFVTLLTAQPAKKNKYYLGIVDQEISFTKLINHRSHRT
jgi:hypothetical protein